MSKQHTFMASRLQYMAGFVISLGLTLAAYLLVTRHLETHHLWPSDAMLGVVLVVIALAQLVAQLVLFLHIGAEDKPRWRLMVALFALLVVVVLVGGSVWIMNNLNYHMGTGADTDTAIIKDEGIHR